MKDYKIAFFMVFIVILATGLYLEYKTINNQEKEITRLQEELKVLGEESKNLRNFVKEINESNRILENKIKNLSENIKELNITLSKTKGKIKELNYSQVRSTYILGVEDGEGVVIELKTEVRHGKGRVLFDIGNGNIVIGHTIQLAMRNAKKVASKRTNTSLRNYDIVFKIKKAEEEIYMVGESAGAAFTVSIIAALTNKSINKSVAVTGVILLNGDIGEVGEVRKKVVAAKEKGITLVLVPFGQEVSVEGIRVVGVKNIREVEKYMLY